MANNNNDPNLYTLSPESLVVYSVDWCPDCRRTKRYLDTNNVPYLEINIDHDRSAEAFVKQVNKGYRSVPTLVFPDGTVLVEPSIPMLTSKFSIE